MNRLVARIAAFAPAGAASVVRTPATLVVASLGLTLAPMSLAHLSTAHDPVMARINVAFSAAAALDWMGPAVAAKGDLPPPPSCTGQTWPTIDDACLAVVDGAKARPIRYVTMARPTGPQSSELMRLPAPVVASR